MRAYSTVRIRMPDRPGSLASVTAALAGNGVNIERLDVVSQQAKVVVDDLLLSAESDREIRMALHSFRDDVTVRVFEEAIGDPATELGLALAAVATAESAAARRAAAVAGAVRVGRAASAAWLRATPEGGMDVLTGPEGLPSIAAGEPFAGRWTLQRCAGIAFMIGDEWASEAFQDALGGAWVALAPCGPFDLLLVSRRLNIAYFPGEIDRLSAYAGAAGAIVRAAGDEPAARSMPAGHEAGLPTGAVETSARLMVPSSG